MAVTLRRQTHDPEGRMSVMDHLRELRRRIITVLVIVVIGAAVAYEFYDQILAVLMKPYCSVPARHRDVNNGGDCVLNIFAPLDGFLARLQVSIIGGAVLTAPLWLYQLWAFVTPGLRRNERKYTVIFVALASVLFAAGVTLAYLILFPGLNVLIDQAGSNTHAVLAVKPYISFVTAVMLIFGISFELPLLVVMLNLVGVLPYRLLRKWQRLAIFLIFVFAGVATPTTDPFTMCAMAFALLVLYESAVLFAFFHDRRKAARQAEAAADEATLRDDVASSVNPVPERMDDSDSWSSLP